MESINYLILKNSNNDLGDNKERNQFVFVMKRII